MKVTGINSKRLALTGTVIVIGLILVLLYIIFYVVDTETQRATDVPVESTQPVEPMPTPVSPEADAPSSPTAGTGAAPAAAP